MFCLTPVREHAESVDGTQGAETNRWLESVRSAMGLSGLAGLEWSAAFGDVLHVQASYFCPPYGLHLIRCLQGSVDGPHIPAG